MELTVRRRTMACFLFCSLLCIHLFVLSSCSEDSEGETSGPPYERPPISLAPINIEVPGEGNYSIDLGPLGEGYVGVSAIASSALKFQVTSGEMSYTYDLPQDGSPIICPINMGDGVYTFTVWQNTSGDQYVEVGQSVSQDVALGSEFTPYLRPSVFCNYDESSACVQKATELAASAENQGDVVKNIYNWIIENVDYDTNKALSVQDGYIPVPDSTFQSGTGICFDYSSLAAAMLRSQGIPCKLMTGYVSPDNVYHAWNMVYIDGSWKMVTVDIAPNTWSRIDTTFASSGSTSFVGDGTEYSDRYTY